MTVVQEATLPIILKGKDVLAKARTGTGKTVAFLLPAIEAVVKSASLDRDQKRPPINVLVVCPTRELASQAAAEATKLLKYHPTLGVQVVIGGVRQALEQKRLQANPCQVRQVWHIALKRDHEYINTVAEGSEETHTQVRQTHLVVPLDKHFSLLYALLKDHIADDVDYKFNMREELTCKVACRMKLDAEAAKNFKEKIDDECRVNMILDNLPVAVLRQRSDGTQSTSYEHGFRVGFKGNYAGSKDEKYFINNHLSFNVIVGFPLLKFTNSISNIKMAKYGEWFNDCKDEIKNYCYDALDLLCKNYGWKTVETTVPEIEAMRLAHYITIGCECNASLNSHSEKIKRSELGWDARVALTIYASFSSREYLNAQKVRNRHMQIYTKIFKSADVIVTPTYNRTPSTWKMAS